MIHLITAHPFWSAVSAYWTFSAAVSSLPELTTLSSPLYQWVYRFLHTIAGNLSTAFAAKIPGIAP